MVCFVCCGLAVNFICDNPAIKAISFVGSNQAGEYIYNRGSSNGKRVQSNMVRAGDVMLLVVLHEHLLRIAHRDLPFLFL
jgi:acyl-CoA reductase-like NAD-dependent aldehyde dehydrogenase